MRDAKALSIAVMTIALALALPNALVAAQSTAPSGFSGGDGSREHPYQISSCEALQAMRDCLTCSYELTSQIDCSLTNGWNAGSGFIPVGDPGTPFVGDFDGRGFVIRGLYANWPARAGVALFGWTASLADRPAAIRNVGLEEVSIQGQNLVGALIGRHLGTVIIRNSHATGFVKATDACAGGLIGDVVTQPGEYSQIIRSWWGGAVYGRSCLGGLIGGTQYTLVRNSYAVGSVVGTTDVISPGFAVGGLIGNQAVGSAVTNCYAIGSVTGYDAVGGLVGYQQGTIDDESYAQGFVEAVGPHVGPLVGLTLP